MAKFNKVPDIARELYERSDAASNYEGALAFKLDPLTELYIRAASTLVGEPKYYTSAEESDSDLLESIHKVAKIDPKFLLQLAVYCREQLYLRSIPLVLIAEFANDKNAIGKVEYARKYVKRVIQRADELTELISYQLARNNVVSRKIFLFDWNDRNGNTKLMEVLRKKFGIGWIYTTKVVEMADDRIKLSDGEGKNSVVVKLNPARTKAHVLINDTKVDEFAAVLENDKLNIYDETKLPMLIRFGVGLAFPKFDKYQIGKYNKNDIAVKMRDAMFLTHPYPKDIEQEEVFRALADGTLESPETWEVMRSTGKMTWHDVVRNIFYKDHKVHNYMAILRNLRNCLSDPSITKEDIELLCRMISDRNAVKYSKQLPFRFLSAYKEVAKAAGKDIKEDRIFGMFRTKDDTKLTADSMMYIGDILDAIDTAASYSVDNFPRLSGSSTVIACDVSGSMEATISKKSSVARFDIGIILGMIAHKFCGHTITGMFGDEWKVFPMSKTSGILKNAIEMKRYRNSVGLSTNGYLVIRYLLDNNIGVDRIMIFTDNQMWDSRGDNETFAEDFIKYQRKYPEVKLYCWDLGGYGHISIPQDTKNVCLIGGWSDRVFGFVTMFEEFGEGKANIVIDKIKAITP